MDWSSGKDTGPKPRKDAVWASLVRDGREEDPIYFRNRELAIEWLTELIVTEIQSARRLMIGFDFPFAYPKGFAQALTGSSDPLSVWSYFHEHLQDGPKGNNRFVLAGKINRSFPGVGPFWFNALKAEIEGLPRKGTDRVGHGQNEKRVVEQQAKGTFTCWQMGGAGAVGGQVMTGLAALERLRRAFPKKIAVWPFQKTARPVHFVEIWPTLIDPVVRQSGDPIRDRAQVRLLAKALAGLPPDRLEAMLNVDAPDEGWILGLGFETELRKAACLT